MSKKLLEFLFYQRPEKTRSSSLKSKSSERSDISTISSHGIPEKLSFSRVINRETCFPCRLDDFMNYLTYVERNAENLRFYLWFRRYIQRFDELPREEKQKSPVWECPLLKDKTKTEESDYEDGKPPYTRPSAQPFRMEVGRIAQMFLAPLSPFELNLSGRDRKDVLNALATTTHPSAFKSVLPQVEISLRQQSHPNFVRYALSTANHGRVAAMRWGGFILILVAIALGVGLSLGKVHKAVRIIVPAATMFFGLCSILDGQRSVCLVLLTFGVRDRFAWEKDTDCLGEDQIAEGDLEKASTISFDIFDGPIPKDEGRESSIQEFEKRNVVSHVLFGWQRLRGIDPEVKRLQRLIVLQNVGISLIITGILIFVLAVAPSGSMY
ncbi:hypothetical protein H072_7626 [Dactylellina haptotyla CBS 200.50]|uniref:RGS domain-containing protein n=1 Tax=Dactylellina haptotyla (strain CBS 200.50) TaxID=1284197 RepID=S8BTQ3_DACHA|nr:hypothetical protein H072_7626 [Dactylellina haptotyla CBS 200.50]